MGDRGADPGQIVHSHSRLHLDSKDTVESAVLAQFYQYLRIENHDGNSSRLLVLEPGESTNEALSGRLECFTVGAATQEYRALSYVWGKPQFTDLIFIDKKRLAITEGLGAALRRLRSRPGQPPLRIWVDQICINQKDTVERSQQVQLMHTIYKNATEVCVWLGPDPDGEASDAFLLVDSLRSIFRDKLLSYLFKRQELGHGWFPIKYWSALRHLTWHPWFRRAWIPQEIGTDAKAVVYWGSPYIEWETLHDCMSLLETDGRRIMKARNINASAVTILYHGFPGLSSQDSIVKRSFVHQLCLSSGTIATDPRDYVYSRLGHPSALVGTGGEMIIQPDYDNTVASIYHEIAIRALTTDSTLTLLNAVSNNGEAIPPLYGAGGGPLPTWVPRWDAGRLNHTIGRQPGRFSASTSRPSGITRASFDNDFGTLVVSGCFIDSIGRCLPKFTNNHFHDASSHRTRKNLGDCLRTAWAWSYCHEDKNAGFSEDLHNNGLFTTRRVYQPDPTVTALRAFLNTLVPVSFFPSTAEHPRTSRSVYGSGIATLEQLYPHRNHILSPRSAFSEENDPRVFLATLAMEGTYINPEVWVNTMEDHVVGRCFALSRDRGYYALVPPTAEPGDFLCLLQGGETPYVLRGDQKDLMRYSFVGEAYVSGLMDDGWNKINADEEVTKFRIW